MQKRRQVRVVNSLLSFFFELVNMDGGYENALRICTELCESGDVEDEFVLLFHKSWAEQNTAELPVSKAEFMSALNFVESYLYCEHLAEMKLYIGDWSQPKLEVMDGGNSQNLEKTTEVDKSCVGKVSFRIVNGGKSANPDIPYVDESSIALEVDF